MNQTSSACGLVCVDCSAALCVHDFNALPADLVCPSCGRIHFAREPTSSTIVPIPFRIQIERSAERTAIVRRWPLSRLGEAPLLALIFALGCAFVWAALAEKSEDGSASFPIFLSCVTACLTLTTIYLGLASLLNRTELAISAVTLDVQHGPLPLPGFRQAHLPSSRVCSIFVRQRRGPAAVAASNLARFELMARMKDGALRRLDGVDTAEEAWFLEHTLGQILENIPRPAPAEPVRPAVQATCGSRRHLEGFSVSTHDGCLELQRRRIRTPRALDECVFSAILSAIFLAGIAIAFTPPMESMRWTFLFMSSSGWLICGYRAAARLFNRTVVGASPEQILVREGPLPWPRESRVDRPALDALYLRRREDPRSATGETFEVWAVSTSGQQVRLLAQFEREELAVLLLHQLRSVLCLPEKDVLGAHTVRARAIEASEELKRTPEAAGLSLVGPDGGQLSESAGNADALSRPIRS